MAKITIRQRNEAKLESLIEQDVLTNYGPLSEQLKRFVAEELIRSATNNGYVLRNTKSNLQDRYMQFEKYYDRLFNKGLTGHALFTGTIEKMSAKDIKNGVAYYIMERGVKKQVSHAELAYKIELLSHKLSAKHDVAFSKFKPIYFLTGDGDYSVMYNIPDIDSMADEFEEMTTQEIMEWFDENNMEVIISDPSKIRNMAEREDFNKAKRKRQKSIEEAKSKYYKIWKSEKGRKG